jgi:hypothetical protein
MVLDPLVHLARRLVGADRRGGSRRPARGRRTSSAPAAVTPDVRRLSWMVGAPPETLLGFCYGNPDPRFRYRSLHVEKRDGSKRAIDAPLPDLKLLQRGLLRLYLDGLYVHPAAMGFRRGFSTADNARRHLGQRIVITADLEDFFANTTADRVRHFYRSAGWDETATSILLGLCTLRGALPQGAPTSPALSNLVNVEMDEALTALATRAGGRYTRYGDDLTFSWAGNRVPSEFETLVRGRVLAQGYRLNRKKGWRFYRVDRGEIPVITGIELGRDGALHPAPEVRREIRRLRHRGWFRRRRDPQAAARLAGYQGYLKTLR